MKVSKEALEREIARACITQGALAKKAEISHVTLRKWLVVGQARADIVGKVARALGVDIEIFVEDEA